jgi:hypothetical protein
MAVSYLAFILSQIGRGALTEINDLIQKPVDPPQGAAR